MSNEIEWIKIEDDVEITWHQKHENTREHCRIEENQTHYKIEMIGIISSSVERI